METVAVFLSRVLRWSFHEALTFFFFFSVSFEASKTALISRLSMEQARSTAAWGMAEKELILLMADIGC